MLKRGQKLLLVTGETVIVISHRANGFIEILLPNGKTSMITEKYIQENL